MMNYLWGKFKRGDFLKEINFSLFVIAVLMSFFALTEGISDRTNLSAENDPLIFAGNGKAERIQIDQKPHTHQQVSVTYPGYWYHKGTVTGF